VAQLTEGLVREFLRYNKRGEPAPYTINEFRQLCYAWLKLNGLPFELDNTAARTTRGVPPEHEFDENGKCKWCPAERPAQTVTQHIEGK